MNTIATWFTQGGPFVTAIVVVLAVAIVVLVERISYVVVRSKIHARPFMEKVISLARSDKVDEAIKICAEHQSALPDMGLVILRSRSRDEGVLMHVADTARYTVLPGLSRRVAWLPTLAIVVATLGAAGFLGNMHGALMANQAMGAALAYAIRPLGVGLLAVIPIVVGHAYLVSETQKLGEQLEEFSARLVNALLDRPDVRLGHRE